MISIHAFKKEKKKKSFLYLPQELKNKYKHRKDYQQIERRFYALNQKGEQSMHAKKSRIVKDSQSKPHLSSFTHSQV